MKVLYVKCASVTDIAKVIVKPINNRCLLARIGQKGSKEVVK